MKVLYFTRNALNLYPPCLNQICYLNDMGIEIRVYFGNCSQNVKDILSDRKIYYEDLGIDRSKRGYAGKIKSFLSFKTQATRIISKDYCENDVLWFGTVDSAFSIKKEILGKKYVLSVLELYDNNKFYRDNIGKIIKGATAVIACEDTRAAIMKSWWKLTSKPFVMPNKPYFHPEEVQMSGSTDLTKRIIQQLQDKRIVLYQGIISSDRDLGFVAEALRNLHRDIYLVLMGNEINSSVERIKEIYEKTMYLGYIPAPLHLEITSWAEVGIANYDDSCLNNLFCAPNKIYEYGGFGLPMLCSDVPGLRQTVEKYGAGICCDFTKVEDIQNNIKLILDNRDCYSENARKLYSSVNNREVMKRIKQKISLNGDLE